MKKHNPSVYIIIINWNEEHYTRACIDSLRKVSYDNLKIVLVDNGSEHKSFLSLKKEFGKYVHIIRSNTNKGFTGGNNIGTKYALGKGADYIMLLNNDTEVEPDFLSKLIETIEADKTIGIIGPKINYLEDKKLLWCIGGKFNLLTGNNQLLWNKKRDTFNKKAIVDVGYVSGCAMLARSSVYKKIGLLDDNYFIYSEESDFNLRAKNELGVRRVCRLDSKIYHKVSLTNTKISGFAEYYLTRNRLYFLRKHSSYPAYLLKMIYFYGIEVPKYTLFYPLIYRKIGILKFFYKGIGDHLRGRFGKSNLFK